MGLELARESGAPRPSFSSNSSGGDFESSTEDWSPLAGSVARFRLSVLALQVWEALSHIDNWEFHLRNASAKTPMIGTRKPQ